MRRRAVSADRFAVRGQIAGQIALKDVEVAQRNIFERVGRHTEIIGEDIRRRMREPFRHQQGGELGSLALIEAYKELAAVRAEPLQRMRQAGGEIPEVAFLHVGDIRSAQFVKSGDPASAVGHVGPLGKLVPVHLADATGCQPHVDAGDGVGNREGVLRHLACPAAILNATWRVVERCPAQRHAADVGRRRRKCVRKLIPYGRILRTGIADAPWVLGIDRTLRRIVRIAEGNIALHRSGIRRGHCRCRHRPTYSCRRQHVTPREHRLSLLAQG